MRPYFWHGLLQILLEFPLVIKGAVMVRKIRMFSTEKFFALALKTDGSSQLEFLVALFAMGLHLFSSQYCVLKKSILISMHVNVVTTCNLVGEKVLSNRRPLVSLKLKDNVVVAVYFESPIDIEFLSQHL